MCLCEATGRPGDPRWAAAETACRKLVTGAAHHAYVWVPGGSVPAAGVRLCLKGTRVQVPATAQEKDPGAATGQTECLRSATKGIHFLHLHVYVCVCIHI